MHYGPASACLTIGGSCVSSSYIDFWTSSVPEKKTTSQTLVAKVATDTVGGASALSSHDINALNLLYSPAPASGEGDDGFGGAVVVADFDQDGYDDLAVGVPTEAWRDEPCARPILAAGVVRTFKRTEFGLAPWYVLSPETIGRKSMPNARFGASLVVGDFNDDDYPDLAVGAPGDSQIRGEVFVFFGNQTRSASPSTDESSCAPLQWDSGKPQGALRQGAAVSFAPPRAAGDAFGAALAAGQLDPDSASDLVVGAPGANGSDGLVYAIQSGCTGGRHTVRPVGLIEPPLGTAGRFGTALAVIGPSDIAIGHPGSSRVWRFGASIDGTFAAVSSWRGAGGPDDELGAAIAATSEMIAIGAPGSGSEHAGHVDVFSTICGAQRCPGVLQSIPARYVVVSGARFGSAVALARLDSELHLVVGAPGHDAGEGAATIFRPDTSGPLFTVKEHLIPDFETRGAFGASLVSGSVR